MNKLPKLSFLISAHNEEKLIGYALNNLIKVHKDYPNVEVLIGLDGCTDKTPEIVKKFSKKYKFFKIFEINERKGKQAVLDRLEQHIKGKIIIVHDADLCFVYDSKRDLIEFLRIFDNKKIGAIADSIDSEMSKPDFLKINSMGFLASAWGNHFLNEYNKKNFAKRFGKILILDEKNMKFCPFVDIYKKEAMEKTRHHNELRAGDHVERTLRILNAGYKIAMYENKNWPHFNEIYSSQSIKDFTNQKVRGIISKGKIENSYQFKIPFFGFYIPFLIYILKNSLKVKRLRDIMAIKIYLLVMVYAIIISKFKKIGSAKDVWGLRIKR